MKKWQKKAIKEIMENFDFTRARSTMLALGWTWHNKLSTPTIKELQDTAERLLIETTMGYVNPHYVSTGGFEAVCDTEKKGMRLLFIVSDWEVLKDGE